MSPYAIVGPIVTAASLVASGGCESSPAGAAFAQDGGSSADVIVSAADDGSSRGAPDVAFTDVVSSDQLASGTPDASAGWALVWADEFNGPNVDETVWKLANYPANVNNELEYYTSRKNTIPGANVFIESGSLVLEAREEPYQGRRYTSGRMDSSGNKAFQYARFEARMKLPAEVGLWPAFWLLGSDQPTVGWPNCGEIDIMEERGRQPDRVLGSLHHGPGQDIFQTQTYQLPASNFHDDWHVFATEWNAATMQWFVDGMPYFSIQRGNAVGFSWPFDQPFFIIFDLAVGGQFDNDVAPAAGMPPQRVYVDYVRVYQKV